MSKFPWGVNGIYCNCGKASGAQRSSVGKMTVLGSAFPWQVEWPAWGDSSLCKVLTHQFLHLVASKFSNRESADSSAIYKLTLGFQWVLDSYNLKITEINFRICLCGGSQMSWDHQQHLKHLQPPQLQEICFLPWWSFCGSPQTLYHPNCSDILNKTCYLL